MDLNTGARIKGDIGDLMKKYTDIRLPAKRLDLCNYQTFHYLDDMFDTMMFDGSDEEKPMRIIAGSYPSFIGNVT